MEIQPPQRWLPRPLLFFDGPSSCAAVRAGRTPRGRASLRTRAGIAGGAAGRPGSAEIALRKEVHCAAIHVHFTCLKYIK